MPLDVMSDEEGVALIEATLILPLLLVLVLGLSEISLYFWNWSLAQKAVQLGVRRAIVSDAVATGPGLDPEASTTYWHGLPPGQSCAPAEGTRSPCPEFAVTCDAADGCSCQGGACGFVLDAAKLVPILRGMQAVLPNLEARNVRVRYATNGLGYVGRPVPVPVDVTVSLIASSYETLFLGDFLGPVLPLRASAQLPSESLLSR